MKSPFTTVLIRPNWLYTRHFVEIIGTYHKDVRGFCQILKEGDSKAGRKDFFFTLELKQNYPESSAPPVWFQF